MDDHLIRDSMEKLETQELVEIVRDRLDDYSPEAIEAAWAVLTERGMSEAELSAMDIPIAETTSPSEPSGIGGMLAFLAVGLVLVALFLSIAAIGLVPSLNPDLGAPVVVVVVLLAGLLALLTWNAVYLLLTKHPRFPVFAVALLPVLGGAWALIFVMRDYRVAALGLVLSILCMVYLIESKRVKNTFKTRSKSTSLPDVTDIVGGSEQGDEPHVDRDREEEPIPPKDWVPLARFASDQEAQYILEVLLERGIPSVAEFGGGLIGQIGHGLAGLGGGGGASTVLVAEDRVAEADEIGRALMGEEWDRVLLVDIE